MITSPLLYKHIPIPRAFCTQAEWQNETLTFGGDIRVGDFTGNGEPDFLVYRCDTQSELKPCFMGAFTMQSEILWSVGSGGSQPLRPASVTVYDIDGDGCDEVICLFHNPPSDTPKESMTDVVFQIRDGKTGDIKTQKTPEAITTASGWGPNWCHQRIVVANLRGRPTPQDLVVKLGDRLLAFDHHLDLLWQYNIQWNEYGQCTAYIPAVGDINGDGRDEINGGYYLLNADGTPRWEKQLAPNMDSVAITVWDKEQPRAICSGGGHILDQDGNIIIALGEDLVPHGQEARVGTFLPEHPAPQIAIRYNGHRPNIRIADNHGSLIAQFDLNHSPNETGLEVIHWQSDRDILYNGGQLFDGLGNTVSLPDLPPPIGPNKMGWYHCIPGNYCGDEREDILIYNPWASDLYIFSPTPLDQMAHTGFVNTARQYNA